jgi:pimeloyl-ACP methyl ester carboxylesterase
MKLHHMLLVSALAHQTHGFLASGNGRKVSSSVKSSTMADLTFTNPDTTGIQEQACIDAAERMQRVAVPVPTDISPSGSVGISYVNWPAQSPKRRGTPPVILVHGFDSSGLEYRRLGPKLAAKGIDVYAVDILGWGYSQLDGVSSFSADSKVTALKSFVETMIGKNSKFCIAGASLGGAAAIELAAIEQDNCAGLILIDAQGFVDGVGPMAFLPKPLAKIGVGVLRSIPLRNSANQMSYFDKETFATEEAQVIGRLHCLRDGWSDAMVSFMQSGGFSPSSKVPTINSPSLVLWGRQDGILDGEEFANKVSMMHAHVGTICKVSLTCYFYAAYY